jgi:rhodanese-related sulfurtransferase
MRVTPLVLSVFALACGGSTPPTSTSPTAADSSAPAAASAATVSPDHVDGPAAHELVKNGALLVDVRSADEFAEKHIEGAINVPADAVTSHDFGGKDKPLVLYCRAGHRSQKAAEALRASGYTNVRVLGPMSAWGN